ncbi:MAG: cell wall-binding repeat-containing protein [Oscillospiraceae bacterium]|nr:cell wall-binding repeat-containing protein [Oscillospiraceae bacterium]
MSDYVEATGHSPKAAVKENIKSATCYKAGSYDEVVYCSVAECKAELSRTEKTIEVTGHSFGNYVSNSNGTQTRTCSVCGEKETINEPVKPVADEVIRVKGKTRYETSFAIAKEIKAKMGVDKFDTIIIASGENFADALAGSYLAKVKGAPILMASGKDANIADIKAFVQSNLKSGGMVYILGGTAAVNQKTEDTLKGVSGVSVKRLKGKNRYLTNIEILKEAGVTSEDILVATGANFADSLSASAVGKPILLVNGKGGLSQEQINYLNRLSTDNLYIIGGTGAVGANYETELARYGKVERIKGASRHETSVAIANKFFTNPSSAVVADAWNFPDGLCGGPLAMTMDAPLILTKSGNHNAAKAYVQANGIKNGAVLGGTARIDDATAKDIFRTSEIIVK